MGILRRDGHRWAYQESNSGGMTNDEMRGADGPPDNAQKVRPDTRKRRDEKQKRKEKNSESKRKKGHPSCARSGLDALTSFASLRKKIGWWGSSLVFLFLFLLFVSSGSSFLPVCQLFLVFVGPFFLFFFCPK
ncbi:hypothetical protein BDP81DRAFT_413208 [Colletotrichum phormii]|uniref:Uncharacterized protein n=1 Tax=Colletotrichum phormii TaxID=359342 RepID=A0AAJ0ELM4_9PEZI|nr:uncharacterized protein BDP81DRAFT_413208 [Colletotrichum phormii]KAK1655697.1 hypothetical protein BDP81DRAFT_413208 [Colletotrichum phormii]